MSHTGIIPADAGSTAIVIALPTFARDHPRGCGEHYGTYKTNVKSVGSSPRMRGALTLSHRRSKRAGIIPADAGSTRFTHGEPL